MLKCYFSRLQFSQELFTCNFTCKDSGLRVFRRTWVFPCAYAPRSCDGGRYIILAWGGHVEGL